MALNFDITLASAWVLIPASVATKYINVASHTELKVLLWLLAAGPRADGEAACEALGLTPKALETAVASWVDRGVLALSERSVVLAQPSATERPAAARKLATVRPSYRFDEVEAALRSRPELKSALLTGQTILGRTFSATEYEILYSLGDYYGLPPESIVLLFSLCKGEGKSSVKAVEDMAAEWHRLGIATPGEAEDYMRRRAARRSAEGLVRSVCGIGERRMSKQERELSSRWVEELRFERPMLELAYEKCVNATGKLSFAYIDKILSNWNSKGISTVEAAAAEQLPPKRGGGKKKKPDTEQAPSYDIDKFLEWNYSRIYGQGEGEK